MPTVPVPVLARSVTSPVVVLVNVTDELDTGPVDQPVKVPVVEAIVAPAALAAPPEAIFAKAAATSSAVAPSAPAVIVTPPRTNV